MLQRRVKKPPESYMCHICFDKGHYITDCPQVCSMLLLLLVLTFTIFNLRIIVLIVRILTCKRIVLIEANFNFY